MHKIEKMFLVHKALYFDKAQRFIIFSNNIQMNYAQYDVQ